MTWKAWGRCAIVTLAAVTPLAAQSPTDSIASVGWKQLGIGAAVAAALVTLDAPIARDIHGNVSPATLTVARQFDRFGDVTGIGPIIGGLAITGLLTHDRPVTRTAMHALESVIFASTVTQVGKYAIGRVRPYGDADLDATDFSFFSGNPGFPSGHSAAAFAMATTLGDAIDKGWARVGLYGLAVGTGSARLAESMHWLSDVVAGAGVGFVSARFVSGRLRLFGKRAPQWVVGPRALGMRLAF